MYSAAKLLDEVLAKYFTDIDNLKDFINITFEEISSYENELLQIISNEGNNALTESLESYLDELKKEAK